MKDAKQFIVALLSINFHQMRHKLGAGLANSVRVYLAKQTSLYHEDKADTSSCILKVNNTTDICILRQVREKGGIFPFFKINQNVEELSILCVNSNSIIVEMKRSVDA